MEGRRVTVERGREKEEGENEGRRVEGRRIKKREGNDEGEEWTGDGERSIERE